MQRIEDAKAQVKAFQMRKRGASSSIPEDPREKITPSKVQKVNHLPHPPWTLRALDEGSKKESQIGQEAISPEGQTGAPRLACGYSGKANHTENDC